MFFIIIVITFYILEIFISALTYLTLKHTCEAGQLGVSFLPLLCFTCEETKAQRGEVIFLKAMKENLKGL